MIGNALFGVAGNPPNFWQSKFSGNRANAPEWLHSIGLDALEIQCGYGVRMSDAQAEAFRLNSRKYKIKLSIHAPYYISLGNRDGVVSKNSLNELKKSVELAQKIGSDRVIFHLGSTLGNREEAKKQAIKTLMRLEEEVKMKGVRLYPEIAGKVNQLGSLDEIISICKSVPYAFPCIDLAHLHARTMGTLMTRKDFDQVIDEIEKKLGDEAIKNLHIHLYPVEWGGKGELRHKAFADKIEKTQQVSLFTTAAHNQGIYYPRYEPFIDLIVQRKISPVIICEAKDSQDVGALEMKSYYNVLLA
ncbi:MAG: TIM barrel protein [Pseudomonadota bacterium]